MQKSNLNFFRTSDCELIKDQPLDTAGTRDAQDKSLHSLTPRVTAHWHILPICSC